MKKISLLILVLMVIFVSCSKNEEESISLNNELGKGFFILNEGGFTYANSSLSFYSEDSSKITNNLFHKVNGSPLGDVAQNITIWENRMFFVINNSGYIYKVDAKTVEFQDQISGLLSPREMLILSEQKAYVSDLYSKGINIINPTTMEHLSFLETNKSTENLVQIENEVFVSNWSEYGQTSPNNTIQIIDTESDQLVDSIIVTKEPNSMVLDKNEHLWVLCSGGYMGEEIASLIQIDPVNRQIIKKMDFADITMSPSRLVSNKNADSLYYINTDIFALSIEANELPTEPIIRSDHHMFYNIAIHPENSSIILTDPLDYVQNGYLFRYKANGTIIDSIQVGIIPSTIKFNY